MSERVWKVVEILSTARQFLEEKGIENPRGNAEALLGKVLNLPRIELYLQHDRPLSDDEVAAFRDFLRRRVHHEPLQLILGSVEFCGVNLEVRPGLLIPRPETEELAEIAILSLREANLNREIRVLDIGTGTGCLAIAIASALPYVRVDAVDADYEAVRCAAQNAQNNGVAERVNPILADLFTPRFTSSLAPPYDLVVSNPPYVTEAEYPELPPEVRNHEAKHTLVAEQNGLAFYRRIAELLPQLLKPKGLLIVEIGHGQNAAVSNIFSELPCRINVRSDMAGIPRIITAAWLKETSVCP
ncbi:peptide chain release factor N(5)-glutamine methyltransferase [candidate division KSB1 bacterium]|nr:MAG: peptide chain release factor N(5)-glutamine methyltransferase [candidate division KSB1 bacterium]